MGNPLRFIGVGVVFLLFLVNTLSAQDEIIRLPLPPNIMDKTQNQMLNLKHDTVLYFLAMFFVSPDEDTGPSDKEVLISTRQLPEQIAVELRQLEVEGMTGDKVFAKVRELLKSGVANRYREIRHRSFGISDHWSEMERQLFLDDTEIWSRSRIASDVKGTVRVIYRTQRSGAEKRRAKGLPPMSVAMTLKKGSEDVRETELIIKREDGGLDWDFYVYDGDGKLAVSSLFLASSGKKETIGPAPYSCMTCHYNPNRRTFENLPRRPYSY